MNSLVTGATGLIGQALIKRLDDPVLMSRRPEALASGSRLKWPVDAGTAAPDRAVDVVFHLAGEPVAGRRWTQQRMDEIRNSRVDGTRQLVSWIANWPSAPKVLVCASAIGFYGDRGDEILVENSQPGSSFLAELCQDWEAEAAKAEALGVRVVFARIGIVLAKNGGALEKMLPPFKMGIGGPLGSGRQWMSWIHLDDVVGLLLHAAHADISGPLNTVAPQPSTNADFSRVLAGHLSRPSVLRAPAFALRLALGKMSDIVLASQKVLPRVAEETGYVFQQPTLDGAIKSCLRIKGEQP
ncbi:MAG: TIGR01777 family oxidoreductase [Myxococcota bacterium]|nr:TIGR01777 family oxidoreductase [Myxococcota bacterium]